jgi:hypothetical protein
MIHPSTNSLQNQHSAPWATKGWVLTPSRAEARAECWRRSWRVDSWQPARRSFLVGHARVRRLTIEKERALWGSQPPVEPGAGRPTKPCGKDSERHKGPDITVDIHMFLIFLQAPPPGQAIIHKDRETQSKPGQRGGLGPESFLGLGGK